MLIKREIFYIKHSSDNADIEGIPHRAIRPPGMGDDDYNTMLNFFRKIVDETKVDGLRYSDDTLMKNNLNLFCLSGGTLLFKIVESVKHPGSGIPELYGFYTPMSGVRAMWLEIDKMCYMLTSEVPGSNKDSVDGMIDYEVLSTYDADSVHGVKAFYRTALENMVKDLMSQPFPINAALTSAPDELYPQGVKFYSNGMNAEKTDSTLKEVEIEFDDKKIRYNIGKCSQPMKDAILISVPYEDERKGGFLKRVKGENSAKAVRQWWYYYTQNGAEQKEICDFVVLDKAFEYSPIEDTFNAYTGKFGVNAERLPRVEGARLVSKVAMLEPEEVPKQEIPKPEPPKVKAKAPVFAPEPQKEEIRREDKPQEIKREEVSKQPKLPKLKPIIEIKPKAEKSEKPAKPEKSEKPPKPLKTKPGMKVHPLLQQAEEHRLAEAAEIASRTRGSEKETDAHHHHHHYSESARPARSRFGTPSSGTGGDDGGNGTSPVRKPPPPPPPPPTAGSGRPARSKFGPKAHPLLRQAEENEKERTASAPARYSPPPKRDSDNNENNTKNNTQEEE